MKPNRILLDMDGVLVNFVKGACLAHNREDPYLHPESLGKFNLYDLLDIKEGAFWEPMDNADWWASLEKMDDAVSLVQYLETLVSPEQICVLSTPSLSPQSIVGKLTWLQNHFPQFSRRFLFGPMKEFCAAPRSLLIDDHDTNVMKFKKAGGKAILVPRPWNVNFHLPFPLGSVQFQIDKLGVEYCESEDDD